MVVGDKMKHLAVILRLKSLVDDNNQVSTIIISEYHYYYYELRTISNGRISSL